MKSCSCRYEMYGQDYMHMALVGVRDGFISAHVSESSPSLKGECCIQIRVLRYLKTKRGHMEIINEIVESLAETYIKKGMHLGDNDPLVEHYCIIHFRNPISLQVHFHDFIVQRGEGRLNDQHNI